MLESRNIKRHEWAEIIAKWKLSGKQARTWCRENQVVYTTFMGWCKRLKITSQIKNIQKQPLNSQFVELKDPPKVQPEISLEHNGIIVHIKGEFDPFLMNFFRNCLC